MTNMYFPKYPKPKTCKHFRQHYFSVMMVDNRCRDWNECLDCGFKLFPDIYQAEELKTISKLSKNK